MGFEVGQIDLGLDVNQKSFNKQLSDISGGAEKSVMSAFKPLGKLIGTALGTAAIVSFTKSCIDLGSDLSEVQNVVDTTFTTMSSSVNDFAKTAIDQFGLSETVAKNYMGVLGTMSKSMGFTEKESYDMAKAITSLSGDVASFYNLSSDESYNKLKAIWTGETEGLKSLGVMLTQTNLDQYALNNGFGKTTAKMTDQEKVMLRYQYTLSALGAAQGDFAKTSDSWANQVRVLSLRFDSLKATLGQGFINLFTPIIQSVNSLIGRLQVLADGFKSFTELVTGKGASDAATGAIGSVVSDMASSTDTLSAATSNLGDTAADAAKKASAGLSGFDKLNNLSESSSDTGTSGDGTSSTANGLSIDTGPEKPPNTSSYENSITGMLDRLRSSFGYFKSYVDKNFKPIWNNLLKEIKPRITTLRNTLLTAWNKIPSILKALTDFVSGSFTESLKLSFRIISDSILTFFDIFNNVTADMVSLIGPLLAVFQGSFIPYFQTLYTTMFTILSGLLDTFRMVFTSIWDTVFPMIESFITLGLPVFYQFSSEAVNSIGELFDEIKAIFDMLWKDTVEPVLTQISTTWRDLMELISEFWEKWGKPIFDNFNEMVRNMGSTLRQVWEEWLKPVWDKFMSVIDEVWDKHLKPFLANFLDLIGEIVNGAINIYNKFIDPIVKWLIDILAPAFKNTFSFILDVVETIVSSVIDVINGIITTIKGIVQFITGVFTADWKKAWTGVKNIFKGIFDSLVGIVKTPINLIIDIINGMIGGVVSGVNAVIRAINKLSFDVPDWVPGIGGETFGFDLKEVTAPKIPKLAEGGYVQPNTPQLAMIGDNRHQGEVVAPEDKLAELLKAAVSSKEPMTAEMILLLRELVKLVTGIKDKDPSILLSTSKVFEAVRNESIDFTKRTGKPAF